MDSRKRQTSTVTPAQPGDFPLWFNVLERGQRLLACGELAQSGRSAKQELAEASQAQA